LETPKKLQAFVGLDVAKKVLTERALSPSVSKMTCPFLYRFHLRIQENPRISKKE
jgi:hypothetical protein